MSIVINQIRFYAIINLEKGEDAKYVIHVSTQKQYALEMIYPICRRILGEKAWATLRETFGKNLDPFQGEDVLAEKSYPEFIFELARLERAYAQVKETEVQIPGEVEAITVNPTLTIVEVGWQNLAGLFINEADADEPVSGQQRVLIWYSPGFRRVEIRPSRDEDLLVLKIIAEQLSPEEIAQAGNLPIGAVDQAIQRAIDAGILLAPRSGIKRSVGLFGADFPADPEPFRTVRVFTLQWHITQLCDLHCKHCYDRSNRTALPLSRAIAVLDDFRAFCNKRHVQGQISFSGGNPLLYPNFTQLYQEAADRGFTLAILGNPAPQQQIVELINIQMPSFFQVSLEGLQAHNDDIRGQGHFDRVLAFLKSLRELGVFSMVMLTLTRANIDEVLPLAEILRDQVDAFTFNRLAMVGEGAALQSVDPGRFKEFLDEFLAAAVRNPIISLKDNLINLLRWHNGKDLFGGCAGFGCSAAFSFISLLPDGEVHACRKFPSPVGNILHQSLDEIFDSEAARRYRVGTLACTKCPIRPVCGGCLAVAHGFGLDIFNDRDPYCFYKD